MELQQFITESLNAIMSGVIDAQTLTRGSGGSINPCPDNSLPNRAWDPQTHSHIQDVEFDVAVTVSEGKEAKGGIGVVTGVFGLGGQKTTDTSNVALTRLRFTIPVALPSTKAEGYVYP